MSSRHASRREEPRRTARRRSWLVALVVLAVLVLGGGAAVLALSGDDPDGRGGDGRADDADGVVVRTRLARVAGTLSPATERRLVRDVRAVVEEYVADAYVAGRTGFPGFTGEARGLARRDADVTTGRRLGDGVILRSARLGVSVVSPRARQPVGATASLRLVLDHDGGDRSATVTGRLLLTPSPAGWRIFGYDLAASGPGERLEARTDEGGDR